MNEEQFCYWLKGYFELVGIKKLTKEQAIIISEHLNLVFVKVTKFGEDTKNDLYGAEQIKSFLTCSAIPKIPISCSAIPEIPISCSAIPYPKSTKYNIIY